MGFNDHGTFGVRILKFTLIAEVATIPTELDNNTVFD